MFENVYFSLDDHEPGVEKVRELIGFSLLLADKTVVSGLDRKITDHSGINFIEKGMAVFEGRPNVVDRELDDPRGMLITHLPSDHNRVTKKEYNSTQAMLLLACAGLDITVPEFKFHQLAIEEISLIREELSEERMAYKLAIAKMADEAYERLLSGAFHDTASWAIDQAELKIRPKAAEVAHNLGKLKKPWLERVKFELMEDGVPAIGQALISEGPIAATKEGMATFLRIFMSDIVENMNEASYPEVGYGLKVRKRIVSG